MPSKPKTSKEIVTRSQTCQSQLVETHTTSNICDCPASGIINADQKEEFKALFTNFLTTIKGDLAKEAHKTSTHLDFLQNKIDQKVTNHGLQPDTFDGNPVADALVWLENFRRIAKLNNWSDELQLNAFPLYLQGIANAWFLALPATISGDLNELFTAFQERFASGPQDWILSQQLSARKHFPNQPINDYITDITRLCKRLKLSDAETVRCFIEGLQGDLQAYISLGRPKTFQEAESLARMKDIVNRRQGVTETQSVLTKLQTMFTKFMEQPFSNSKVIAATAPAPNTSDVDKKLEELSNQLKQIQTQQQWYQQKIHAGYDLCYRPNFRRATRDNNQVRYKPRKRFTNTDRPISSRYSAARHDVSTCKTGVNSIDDIHMEWPIVNSHSRLDDSFSDSPIYSCIRVVY